MDSVDFNSGDFSNGPVCLTPPPEGIVPFVERAAGFTLDSVQRSVLECTEPWVLINCFRQWGKLTITAGKAVYEAWTRPGTLVLVATPGSRQSGEFMQKAEEMVQRLGVRVRGDGNNNQSILLPNGSRIVGLPGNADTVRGFSKVRLLILDEASRMPDELYVALRPCTVGVGGSIWMLSTPNGRRGFFWETWKQEGWAKFAVTGWMCERFPKARLELEQRTMRAPLFAQEYECQFTDAEMQLVPGEYLEAAVRPAVEPLVLFAPGGKWKRFDPEDKHIQWREYTVGVDLGKRRNPAAIAVIEKRCVRTGRQIAWDLSWEETITWNVRYLERVEVGTPYHETVQRIRRVVKDPHLQKGHVELVVDATGVGEMPLEALEQQQLGCTIVAVTVTSGDKAVRVGRERWSVPRWELLTDLALVLENGKLGIAGGMAETERLLSEMRGWKVKAGERRDRIVGGADEDGKDDLGFAVALASWRSAKVRRELNGRRRVV